MRVQFVLRVLAVALAALCGARPEVSLAQSKPIVAETYYNTFSRAHKPLARIRPGETVVTKTIDASGHDDTGTVRGVRPNPLTGPFYVEGAEPGDALVVRFTRVRMNRNWGLSSYRLGLYSLTPESIEGIYPNRYKPGEIIKDREQRRSVGSRLDASDGAAERAVERGAQAGVSGEADARLRRRCAGRRFRAHVEPVGIVRRQSRLQRDRRRIDRDPAGLSSWRTAVHRRWPCAARRRRADRHRHRNVDGRRVRGRGAQESRASPDRAWKPASTSSVSAASPSLRARPIAGCRWRRATW